jgi:hypothetical protein
MLAQLSHEIERRDCVLETVIELLLVLQAIEDQASSVKVMLDEIDGREFVDHRGSVLAGTAATHAAPSGDEPCPK